jgi:hypothetical protein
MIRITTFCVVSSTLAVIALSANRASAIEVTTPKVEVPKVSVHPPQPKVNPTYTNKHIRSVDGPVGGNGASGNLPPGTQPNVLNPQPLPP